MRLVEDAHGQELDVLIDVGPQPVYRPLTEYLAQVHLKERTDLIEAERQAEEKYDERQKA